MSKSGQKFIARNRAPRVQIEYDVELYGAEKSVQLPFVMGVMSDLSGKSAEPLPSVADRKFLEIDVDNFDDRMKAMKPRAAFTVPNTLTGEGNLSVDLTFEQMEDFSPAAIAQKVAPLRQLLDARTQLAHLMTYMDGKTGAEDLIAKLISDPASFAQMAGSTVQDHTAADSDALDSLRAVGASMADPEDEKAATDAAFEQVRQSAPKTSKRDEAAEKVAAFDALAQSAEKVDAAVEPADDTADILETLRSSAQDVEATEPTDTIDVPGDTDTVNGTDLEAATQDTDDDDDSDLDVLLTEEADSAKEVPSSDANDIQESEEEDFDLDALLADAEDADNEQDDAPDELSIDDDDIDTSETEQDDAGDDFDLDALIADADDEETDEDEDTDAADAELDELSSDDDDDDVDMDVDALLSDDEDEDDLLSDDVEDDEDDTPIEEPFGTMSAERPEDAEEGSRKFRIAILGDFSGRASRGQMDIGADLGKRKPIKFDIDNLDAVISRFATTLVLPIGNDGAGVEVKLNELDDLHPDELYENVEVFEELSALRQRVAMGDGAAAISEMQGWAGEFGDLKLTSHKRAKGAAVPADRKLSDFQSLIGDMQGQLATPSPASDLIARIVGPFVQAASDPAQDKMLAVIDDAISGAMRAILHHPDFQAVEATWRSLELLARRIQTGAGLDIVLYDVSAEEWAADLSAQDDLAESGLFDMLGEEPRLDQAQGPLSAVFGLYTLEETPPHAELLARMSKICNWMHAPFVTAISPKFLETPKSDRHPLVSKTWDALSELPEAKYIGLAAPRFLLRLPYGKKTEPVDPFDFEEFSLRSGLKGMLWANPVVLSAILMAETVNQKGKAMQLGQIMSIDDMPFHYMTDQYGDQIALPCTERMLNTRTAADVVARGFIPLLSMKGQNVVRQGSFQALGGGGLAGPWGLSDGAGAGAELNTTDVGFNSKLEPKAPPAGAAQSNDDDAENDDDDDFGGMDDDDLSDLGGFDDDDAGDDDGDLDDLLAGFDDDDDDASDDDDDDMDADLAAMLEGL